MKNIIKLTVIFLFILLFGIFYLSLNKDSSYDTEYLVGNKLVNVNLKSLEGNKDLNHDVLKKNKYTLINFWASWCAPCRIEHPYLMELSKEQKLKILGINFKDKKVNALKFLENLGNPYDYIAKDNLGKQSVSFGIYGVPESVLVDSDLIILKKVVGPLNIEDLKDIKKIINSL
tara:strand:+ start:18 stop:539 length:522 start_codon:yes stop_codon:yes gene_type:complete